MTNLAIVMSFVLAGITGWEAGRLTIEQEIPAPLIVSATALIICVAFVLSRWPS